jgi:hypothetical protein
VERLYTKRGAIPAVTYLFIVFLLLLTLVYNCFSIAFCILWLA